MESYLLVFLLSLRHTFSHLHSDQSPPLMEAKHYSEEQKPQKDKAVVRTDDEEPQREDDNHTVSSAGSSPLHTVSSSPQSSTTHLPPFDSRFRSNAQLPSKSPDPQPRDDSESPPHAVDSPSNSSLTSDHSTISRVSSPRVETELSGPEKSPSPARYASINALAMTPVAVSTADSQAEDAFVERPRFERGGVGAGSGGGGGRRLRPDLSILKSARRESMVKRALLVFRVCGFVFCLVAFSVMAADRNQGWALDSFYRYKEFRFCLAVNAMGFIYSGLQALDLAYFSATGKHIVGHRLRPQVDFSLDQILSYLLLSAISSSATRVEDWQLNWGKDQFPELATASVAISGLSFVAFALCSVISGYTLCTLRNI